MPVSRCERWVPALKAFSNPDKYHDGERMGVPGSQATLDVDGPADAARTLNETRQDVANRRQPPSAADAPDLVVKSAQVNDDTLSATVHNQGSAAADATRIRYYVSVDPLISVFDTEVGSSALPGVGAPPASLPHERCNGR